MSTTDFGIYFRLGWILQCRVCGAYTNEVEIGPGKPGERPVKVICLQEHQAWHEELLRCRALLLKCGQSKISTGLKKQVLRLWRQRRRESVENNVRYVGLARHPEILY